MRTILTTILILVLTQLKAQNMEQPKDVVLTMFKATDERNWETVKNTFANTVELDYSSMTGDPKQNLKPKDIITSWKSVLPGFTQTHHQLGNIISRIEEEKANLTAYGTATHYLQDKNGSVWTVVGTYDFELAKQESEWKINKMVFNYKYQDGNTDLVNKAIKKLKDNTIKKVTFKSDGLNLVGNLYYPSNYVENEKYPAIVVSGSWTTVKEQMAGLYAKKLAEQGFITLAFDFRNFG